MSAFVNETIGYVDDEREVESCFMLMRQLRPHLSGPEEFVVRWRRQAGDGYRLLALRYDGEPLALAGFRVEENLMHGRHVYVDDLVTDAARRRAGLGERLMRHLLVIANEQGCTKLLLDTGLDNALGHRFYFRQSLLATALRFSIVID